MPSGNGDCWIQTYTGRQFFLLRPRPSDVVLLDVAHSLATTNRFAGHATGALSVAQHSIMVSEHVPPALQMAGLFHDAGEFAFTDITRPFKGALFVKDGRQMVPFSEVEERVRAAVFEALGIAEPTPAEWGVVKEADNRSLLTEKRDRMAKEPCPWSVGGMAFAETVEPWTWECAEIRFLARYEHLRLGHA